MDPVQTAKLRARLMEEIDDCRADIERLGPSAQPIAPDRAIGRVSRADSLNDQGISQAALKQQEERLYKLEQALERIHLPDFGNCARCGRAIPVERLAVLPESTFCVQCAG